MIVFHILFTENPACYILRLRISCTAVLLFYRLFRQTTAAIPTSGMKNKSSLPLLLPLLIAISAAQINEALSCSPLSSISMENVFMSSLEVRCRHQAEKCRGWPFFFSGLFTNILEERLEVSDSEDLWVLHKSQHSLSTSLRMISIIWDLSLLCLQTEVANFMQVPWQSIVPRERRFFYKMYSTYCEAKNFSRLVLEGKEC